MAASRSAEILEEPPFRLTSTAFTLAVKWHGRERLAGSEIPYLTHLMDVSSLVLAHGGEDVQSAAALLHDAIESAANASEAGAREELIRYRLGDPVGDIVIACTDGRPDDEGRREPWEQRKERYLERLDTVRPAALLVACCDELLDARSIVERLRAAGAAGWDRLEASREPSLRDSLRYYERLALIFGNRLVGPWQEFADAVEAMHELAERPRRQPD